MKIGDELINHPKPKWRINKISVSPDQTDSIGFSKLAVCGNAVSNTRVTVVPTAITCPPRALVWLIKSAVAWGNSAYSECILWRKISSVLTGANVPAPTCKVTKAVLMPLDLKAANTLSSKCRLAVGAATLAKFGWVMKYRFDSGFRHCHRHGAQNRAESVVHHSAQAQARSAGQILAK